MTYTCLELIHKYGFGFSTITKSDLILRDIDLLQAIHRKVLGKWVGNEDVREVTPAIFLNGLRLQEICFLKIVRGW